MKKTIAALAFAASAGAHAEPTVMRIPELGWEVRFDAPATSKLEEQRSAQAYRYSGNAGRFNLSLFIENPGCPGGVALEDHVRCFAGRIGGVPNLVTESIKVERIARGVLVSYLVYAKVEDKLVKMLHTHLLFADKGKWGDLHASVIRPSTDEVTMLLGLGDRFDFSD
jgi:hypothetical protein